MTDKPTSLAAAFAELGEAIEDGLDTLGTAMAGQVPYTAGKALNALLDGDEDTARQTLADLDAEQLRDIWRAASSLVLMTDGLARASTRWKCARCNSSRWVAASLTGPDYDGSKSIRQCVPCGHYSTDPVKTERPTPKRALGMCLDGDDDKAAELLGGLTSARLAAIEDAAAGLAQLAARRRAAIAAAEDPDDPDPGALRRDLDEVITALNGRGPGMIHDAVWSRVGPVLRVLREQLAEQTAIAQQTEEALGIAHQTSNASERARAEAVHRAEQAERRVERLRALVAREIRTGNGASAHTLRHRFLSALDAEADEGTAP